MTHLLLIAHLVTYKRIRNATNISNQLYLQARLLLRLSHSHLLDRFAGLGRALGKRPDASLASPHQRHFHDSRFMYFRSALLSACARQGKASSAGAPPCALWVCPLWGLERGIERYFWELIVVSQVIVVYHIRRAHRSKAEDHPSRRISPYCLISLHASRSTLSKAIESAARVFLLHGTIHQL